MKEILKVENITKTFKITAKQQKIQKTKEKIKTAVDNLSLNAYEGEIYGLLGPNGAGKTTTLRVISTLINADSGDAYVNGISVKENPKEVRKNIGFLTSELKLEEFFTPNYLFNFFSDIHQVDPIVRDKRREELFAKFGIDEFAEVKIANLSTGMKQKISLVISIVHDPKFIIFDEPTNGLDVLTAKVVTDFLLELKQQGKSVILSTHIFTLVEKLCDRVGIIVNGKMILSDTLGNVTKEKCLEDVFFDIYAKEVGEI
ncbi:MAG: ABC transporter ATP-binding protein [bacterium]